MPYQTHYRVRCNGYFGPVGQPLDIFSFGFAIAGAGDFLTIQQENDVTTAVENYVNDTRTHIAQSGRLDEVAFSTVGPGGTQVGDTRRHPANASGNAGTVHPLQVAYRVSLGDGQRGRSHRGGWYVPYCNWDVDPATGVASQAQAQQSLASALELVTAVNTITAGNRVVIASGVLGNLPVTQLRVGRAPDTVRTRRNALNEAYEAAAVP